MSAPETPLVMVVDVETTMKCPVGKNKANPFWPENRVVMVGLKEDYTHLVLVGKGARCEIKKRDGKPLGNVLMVGHNIAFDTHHLMVSGSLTSEQLGQLQIWDTQLAEYLLSGQQHIFPSLDEVVAKRGGTKKDNRVTAMFEAGKGADEVPTEMLKAYLKEDLENTEKVFYSQFAEAMDKGMLPLIWSQMDARLATIEMSYNGLAINKPFLEDAANTLTHALKMVHDELTELAESATGVRLEYSSPKQLSTILFGGEFSYKERKEVGTYKNGNPKFTTVTTKIPIKGFGLTPNKDWKNNNGYSTDDAVLDTLLASETVKKVPQAVHFLTGVKVYREKSKQLSTYFEGLLKVLMPDGRIHHTLNHAATVTGRLSGSEPNMQNQPKESPGEVKKAFVSRWGEDGVFAEADYGQLEMVMLAVLSGDRQLMQDIMDGVDMHSMLFKKLHGRLPSSSERWQFKRAAFALIYGGGVKAIASQGNTSEAEAKLFRGAFYDRYPGVKVWHDTTFMNVANNRVYTGKKDAETGYPIGESTYISPMSNRRYVFKEYANSPEVQAWKREQCSFSMQETKNYPVQGGATGDIVPLVLGKLFRVLKNDPVLRDKCLMVLTVHDSVEFDIHKDVLSYALTTIKRVMEDAPRYIDETWGFKFPLKLKVGLSYGPNWFAQEECDTSTLNDINHEKEAA